MRIPDLEEMIERYAPIPHPHLNTWRGVFVCHVCGQPSTPDDKFVSMQYQCEICNYSAHYHRRCVDQRNRVWPE